MTKSRYLVYDIDNSRFLNRDELVYTELYKNNFELQAETVLFTSFDNATYASHDVSLELILLRSKKYIEFQQTFDMETNRELVEFLQKIIRDPCDTCTPLSIGYAKRGLDPSNQKLSHYAISLEYSVQSNTIKVSGIPGTNEVSQTDAAIRNFKLRNATEFLDYTYPEVLQPIGDDIGDDIYTNSFKTDINKFWDEVSKTRLPDGKMEQLLEVGGYIPPFDAYSAIIPPSIYIPEGGVDMDVDKDPQFKSYWENPSILARINDTISAANPISPPKKRLLITASLIK